MPTPSPQKPIRFGVVGARRGQSFMNAANTVGMQLVALCDSWEKRLEEAGKQYNVATYTDYDRFLSHDMDAVVLANYFHEHAPFAIKALAAGKHVMSETAACKTLAEGARLCRAVEQSGKIYCFAENYPYFAFNQEMRRLYQAGEIGKVLYAEGEYNHPMPAEERMRLAPGVNHWRNWIPSTYYCTHALAPLMHITDTMPVKVNALSIADDELTARTVHRGDPGSVTLCRMDNGAVFRLFGLFVPGHSIWYRLNGQRGAMESTRGPGYGAKQSLRVVHDEWDLQPGQVTEKTYLPEFPEQAAEAKKTGHGGGDFFTNFHFARAIRTGEQPWLNVYRAVAMSAVGILAWKSALEDGRPFAIPDFRDESARQSVENDHFSPFPQDAAPGQPAPSIRGHIEPPAQVMARAKHLWTEMGFADR
jgi:predicted dehydrogenase